MLVELNTNLECHRDVIGLMERRGFKTTIHPEAIRKEGPFKGVVNHIFKRDAR